MDMDLGKQIEQRRKEKNISQEKLAELVGVSRQTIYKWEANLARPKGKNLQQLNELLRLEQEHISQGADFVKIKGYQEVEELYVFTEHKKSTGIK